ncbi:MAG: hypothetical protein TQ37_00410 [Candidatus Synechococcus spongiarum 15L]|uniref:Uncharacterized protein n=1 Tax=Candidatus Synechococcus spongiarum 15L TaxID=1608419 RepID=A0A0G8B046_9SYNE|nr:MAG: hypothetical protein TQ37_00410 [Candidatus Synechococcus spongiarum 15L]
MVAGFGFGAILHTPQRHRELPVRVEAWLSWHFPQDRWSKDLNRYVSEFSGRPTIRLLDTVDIMVGMVAGMVDKMVRDHALLWLA